MTATHETAESHDAPLSEPLTAEDAALLEWGRRAAAGELRGMQEALKQLITIATALLAGSAAILAQLPYDQWVKGLVAALLLGTLMASLWGWLPHRAPFSPGDLALLAEAQDRLLRRKSLCLALGSGMLVAAMMVALSAAVLVRP